VSHSARKTKHDSITQLLGDRIEQGGYLQGKLPGEHTLASELGVSYLTVRKATRQLVENGMLTRLSNGRLAAKSPEKQGKRGPQIGVLVAMFPARSMNAWISDLNHVVDAHQGSLRLISYAQESDPRIFEAFDADLDGLFLIYSHKPSLLLKNQLVKHHKRLVSLWYDMTAMGIPSIENAPARFVSKTVEHLKQLGHQRVEYLNVSSTDNSVTRDRIHFWKLALEHFGLDGQLFQKMDYDLGGAACNARQLMMDLHQQGDLKETTAIICGTTEMAVGVQRACHELNLVVGRDISVAGFGEMYTAKMSVPSITAIQPAPRRALLDQGLQWIMSQGKDWDQPLQIASLDVELFVGESTGPPRVKA
jgi:DNA-binding LacI/PurR family transcriptional regulator